MKYGLVFIFIKKKYFVLSFAPLRFKSWFRPWLIMTSTKERVQTWQPPPASRFKLNFDAAIFAYLGCSGVGVIIRNEKGEVMGAMIAKGRGVTDSMEAEALACRRVLEFAVDIGITELVIEGDCAQVISAITSTLQKRLLFATKLFRRLQKAIRKNSFVDGKSLSSTITCRILKHM